MVSRNNAVFRFILDIKDFLTKGRQVSQVLNKISGDSHKASSSVEQLGTTTQKTGQNMAAAAVNFQTATQGMLNLTTAGVQTFTSFSNLDRAANRLAQAQVGLARAEDLLNNKQLRLNELREKGLGHSAKAIQLEKFQENINMAGLPKLNINLYHKYSLKQKRKQKKKCGQVKIYNPSLRLTKVFTLVVKLDSI